MLCRSSALLLLAVLLGALFLVSCSSGKRNFTIKGTVSYQGKPLSSGIVRLHMAENRMAMARIRSDGSFEVTDVIPGEAKVTIEVDPAFQERMTMPLPKGAPAPKQAPLRIPVKYKDAKTSGLVFTLAAGKPLKIDLQ